MSDKLKPCPFCGTKPHPITADLLTRPCFYYECENKTCHAAEKGWHDTEQEAIDAWNTRPIEDALQARIAELEKKSMQCPRCGDPITNELGDNPICGACALASELNAMALLARITELETTLQEIHQHYDDTHAEEVNELNARIAELEAENAKLKELLEKQEGETK